MEEMITKKLLNTITNEKRYLAIPTPISIDGFNKLSPDANTFLDLVAFFFIEHGYMVTFENDGKKHIGISVHNLSEGVVFKRYMDESTTFLGAINEAVKYYIVSRKLKDKKWESI